MIHLELISLLKLTAEVAVEQSSNSIDYLTVFISILGSVGIGSIVSVILSHHLTKKSTISPIDKERLEFYKYIYFSAVMNPVYQPALKTESRKFLHDLILKSNFLKIKHYY